MDAARELRWRGSLPVPGLFTGEHYWRLEPGPGDRPGTSTRLVQGKAFSGLLVPLAGGLLEATWHGFESMNAS